ncbi:hypothetical protein CLOM_g6536 [Closterium sp. NIES-68]|nr:hypothetical protein CLOM_g6536 [Closterium sp. NIES-68]GJP75672.1 hypothetical protein CLOP_g6094 [Closterium sp. NIES-67]
MSPSLLAANVYISLARCASLLQSLASSLAASRAPTRILHVFEDEPYARTGVTLAGPARDLERTVILISGSAISTVDLTRHVGSHPSIGVVDHVALRPLLHAELADAATSARNIGEALGKEHGVPVYLYGAASPTNRALDAIRRDLGYFRPSPARAESSHDAHGCVQAPESVTEASIAAAQTARGNSAQQNRSSAPPDPTAQRPLASVPPSVPPPMPLSEPPTNPPSTPPDFGPLHPNPLKGSVAVGAAPWVYNYNIPIQVPPPITPSTMTAARRVARRVSERGGGLLGVQSMALVHGEGCVEIACNLSEPDAPAASRVQAAVAEGVEREGVEGARVLKGYSPGLTRQEALLLYRDLEGRRAWM